MNVEQCQAAANPQTEPIDFGCESVCRLLSCTLVITISYYSAIKPIPILPPYRGQNDACYATASHFILLETDKVK